LLVTLFTIDLSEQAIIKTTSEIARMERKNIFLILRLSFPEVRTLKKNFVRLGILNHTFLLCGDSS
jgi:hypothetical protein